MNEPPKILLWFLDVCCPDSRPDLKGDFLELYEERQAEKGGLYSNRKLLRDAISVLPLNFIIKEKQRKPIPMFSTNLKIARRNLLKNRLNTIINVTGLSVSLTICILITLFVKDELSFDKHFADGDLVYRVAGNYSQGGPNRLNSALTTYLVKPMIEGNVEGLEVVTRADFQSDVVMVNGDKQYMEDHLLFADSTFFDVFKVPFLKGDPATAIDDPNSVVIDQPTAIKYFGTEDVLGKLVNLRGKEFQVTGVFKPIPHNTHFTCNLIFPISGVKQWYADWILTNASGTSLYTYIRTKHHLDQATFGTTLTELIRKNWGWQDDGIPRYFLQPLRSIHLESNFRDEAGVNGNITTVYIFSITAIVIFVLACINFINLTVAGSFQRGKEVGMKKVMGSSTRAQVGQFQTESFLVAGVSTIIAIILVVLIMPLFNEISGKALQFNPIADPVLGLMITGILLFIGFAAGAAPAIVLLRSSTIGMLKDTLQLKTGRSYIRSGLIVFQFAISVTLISCTLIVTNQIRFIRNTNLGIDPEAVVMVPFQTEEISARFESMKTELLQNKNVISVAASSGKVTQAVGNWRQYKTDSTKDQVNIPSIVVSHDFFETMKAQIIDGRSFSKEYSTDLLQGYILNESAVDFLNMKDPVGQDLIGTTFTGSKWFLRQGVVVGVVKDFHFASLHTKVGPTVFCLGSNQTETLGWMEVRISSENMPETVEAIKSTWARIAGDRDFIFEFMDEAVAKHYQAEDRFLKIFTTFSMLSIMLGGLGLFGLTAFMAKRRTKEIGIRRVMGASTGILIQLMSKDFLKLVAIANLIGWPIAWYFMNNWLKNFAYQTSISVWVFVGTGVAVLAIAFGSILYHSLKVATTNPVRSLRSE
ncbi:MAG TPA: ABC transporter permease [Cyclobacteriaceae bacterium]|nr:ABC transporter permease [Cyclobacteriaceae bacterium]